MCVRKKKTPLLFQPPRHNALADGRAYTISLVFFGSTSNTGYAFDAIRRLPVGFALAPKPPPFASITPFWCLLLSWRESAAYSADAWTRLQPLASQSCCSTSGGGGSTGEIRESGGRRMPTKFQPRFSRGT